MLNLMAMKNTFLIKNMVCHRCILSIENILKKLGITKFQVSLGRVTFFEPINDKQKQVFKHEIEKIGFSMLSSKEDILIEEVKIALLEGLKAQSFGRQNLSEFIQNKLGVSYSKISKLFSSIEGKTIEKYLINLRIEKVKELIFYNELSISQIAYELGYSTPQHLSRQFKQVTGLTTTEFKQMGARAEFDKI